MKKIIFSALAALAFVGVSCSSDDNSSIDDNGTGNGSGGITPPNKKVYVIDKIKINATEVYGDESEESEYSETVVDFKYDHGKLMSIESVENDMFYKFIYDDKGIVKEVESQEVVYEQFGDKKVMKKHIVSDFLGLAPFDFGKKGKINVHNKGNVENMTFYAYDDKDKVIGEYKTTLRYDNRPFAAFHTLNTTGAVDLSKKTQIDFGVNTSAFNGLGYANSLLPANNPIYLNHEYVGTKEYSEVNISYTYDANNYPISFEYTVINQYESGRWNPETKKYDIVWLVDKTTGQANITYKELK